jgi:TolA-binding protein
MKTHRLIVGGISLVLFAAVGTSAIPVVADSGAIAPAASKSPTAPAPGSLDDQLLKGLDNQLLDDLHDKSNARPKPSPTPIAAEKPVAKTSPKPSPSSAPSGGKPADTRKSAEKPADKASSNVDPLDESLRNSLSNDLDSGEDIGKPAEDSNPLARISRKMRSVAERLGQQHSDERTQRQQQQIAAELESLVKQLAQQQQQEQAAAGGSKQTASVRTKAQQPGSPPGHSAGPDSDQPAHNSSEGVRKPRVDRPDPAASRRLIEKALDRLNLPAKDREEMLQAPPDEFLPGYEAAIKRYFERIVEGDSNNPQAP